jgi:hypothetical protein
MQDEFKKKLQLALLVLAFGFAGLWVTILITEGFDEPIKEPHPVGTTTPAVVLPSEYPDYDALSSLKYVVLAHAEPSSEANKTVVEGGVKKTIEITGKFSRVYLYAEVSVNEKPLTDWDSLYMKIAETGGHLYRPKSLATPSNELASLLLFNTSAIPFLPNLPYSSAREPLITNWFGNVFNATSQTWKARSDIFISTTREGMIHLVALYYDCDKETPNCSLKVVN